MSKSFVHEMFRGYLEKMKLDVNKMSKVQFVETQRAFMGGMASLMYVMREFNSEEEAFDKLDKINNELTLYWRDQKIIKLISSNS